jgi:hypothetical protein
VRGNRSFCPTNPVLLFWEASSGPAGRCLQNLQATRGLPESVWRFFRIVKITWVFPSNFAMTRDLAAPKGPPRAHRNLNWFLWGILGAAWALKTRFGGPLEFSLEALAQKTRVFEIIKITLFFTTFWPSRTRQTRFPGPPLDPS